MPFTRHVIVMIPMIYRKRILRFAQALSAGTPTPGSPQAPGSPPSPAPAATPIAIINVRTLPNFKSNLFSVAPKTIDDLNIIVNKINKYMLMLGDKRVGFTEVYTNPSSSGSNFSNSLKNLLNFSKWLYRIMVVDRAPYTVNDLKKIYSDMEASLNGYTFPEPTMSNTKNDLVLSARQAKANLGP